MSIATQILEVAERRMRNVGYNAVSYRDIAGELDVKPASLHYYFPKKEDLGVALVKHYSTGFEKLLSDRAQLYSDPQKKIAAFVDVFRYALDEERLLCLCAVLGAEAPGLPSSITNEVKVFFDKNIAWLAKQYDAVGASNPNDRAKTTLSLLEGAMIVTAVKNDIGIFNAASDHILAKSVEF